MKRSQQTEERLNLLIEMIAADGNSPPGELPPGDTMNALANEQDTGRLRDLAQREVKGRGPPDWAGPPDNPGNGGGN